MNPTHCIPYYLHAEVLEPPEVVSVTATPLYLICAVFLLINHGHVRNSRGICADDAFLSFSPWFALCVFFTENRPLRSHLTDQVINYHLSLQFTSVQLSRTAEA